MCRCLSQQNELRNAFPASSSAVRADPTTLAGAGSRDATLNSMLSVLLGGLRVRHGAAPNAPYFAVLPFSARAHWHQSINLGLVAARSAWQRSKSSIE